jgi:hypothetical protein
MPQEADEDLRAVCSTEIIASTLLGGRLHGRFHLQNTAINYQSGKELRWNGRSWGALCQWRNGYQDEVC